MRISIAVVKRFLDRYGSSVKMKNGVDVADGESLKSMNVGCSIKSIFRINVCLK